MQVRDKKSGEVEQLRHGPATDAVAAGTHAFVNFDDKGKTLPERAEKKVAAQPEGSAA